MSEDDLKRALRDAMAASPTPPPMSETRVLDAARRARKQRRAAWSGGASAVAVAAVAVAAVLLSAGTSGTGTAGVGGAPDGSAPIDSTTTIDPPSTTTTEHEDTETTWPDGQTDRTASSGPHYEQGDSLDELVEEIVPDGYETPTDLTAPEGFPLRSHQAQFREYVNGDPDGDQVWEYYAGVPVTKDGGAGQVSVMVVTPGDSTLSGEGCAFADVLWDEAADCEDVTVAGGTVGLATGAEGSSFGQWAGYRHPDGTVVYVAQALVDDRSGLPPLTALPFTPEQLATLAVDPRFQLD